MLAEGQFKFALESLEKYAKMANEKAFLFSPHLIYHNLLMIYFGARDENFLRDILHIPNYISKAVVKQYYVLGGNLQFFKITERANSCICFHSRFWIERTKNIRNKTHELFNSHHQVMDFDFATNPERGKNFVNNSVVCITKHNISNLLPPNSINSNTEGVLFNAIYCEDELDGNSEFDFTYVKENTSQHLGARIIEVPLQKSKISMFFLFPHYLDKNNVVQKDGIIQLLGRLTTEENSLKLHDLLNNQLRVAGFRLQKKNSIPMFKIEEELQTNELLEILGIPELIMSRGTIELLDFTKQSLKLGGIVDRIKIEKTKENFTASASNAFFTNDSCQFERTHINTSVARNKCVCLIYHRFQRNILFCGVV